MNTTTSTGTTVTVENHHRDRVIILTNPAAPYDLRRVEAGRLIGGGFQPAPFAPFGLTTETMRIIADVIDRENGVGQVDAAGLDR